MENYAM